MSHAFVVGAPGWHSCRLVAPLVLIALAGCRQVVTHAVHWPSDNSALTAVDTDEPVPAALERDVWRPRQDVVAWGDLAARPAGLAPADTTGAVRWELPGTSWNEPEEPETLLGFSDDKVNLRAFTDTLTRERSATLLKFDTLWSWNYAILAAQRCPEQCGHWAPLLERLVTSPPAIEFDQASGPDLAKPSSPGARWFPTGTAPPPTPVAPKRAAAIPSNGPAEDPPRRTISISIAMQCAAAESWCRTLVAANAGDPVDALAPVGRALLNVRMDAAVRNELLRVVARWIPPADIPGVARILESPPGGRESTAARELRLTAIDACLIHALCRKSTGANGWDESLWPATIDICRADRDAGVRRAFGRWAALAGAPTAFVRLKEQTADVDPRVREESLLSLGIVGSEEARAELKRQAARSEERVREFACRGLARFGPHGLTAFASDDSFHVRIAVAEELAEHPTPDGAALLRQMTGDRDPQVQRRAATSAGRWPDSLAIPVLLQGLRSSSRTTRDVCWQEIHRRVPAAGPFDLDAPEPDRRAAIERLIAAARLPSGIAEPRADLNTDSIAAEAREAEVASVLELLALNPRRAETDAALKRAEHWTIRDVPAIERWIASHPETSSGSIERELLPRISPVHAALVGLMQPDVFARRRAAQTLAAAADEATLSPFVLRRLADVMAAEHDQLVWRYVMGAALKDGAAEGARLAELAVNHSWADIRILGCDYAARHHRAEFAPWLLPLLAESNRRVRLAAVDALGRCGHPIALDGVAAAAGQPAQPGLRALLVNDDLRVRLAAAAAMSRLGDPQGMQELTRFAFHDSDGIREQAVREMGDSGHSRFVETLIQLGWTERNDTTRRAVAQALERLVPDESRPPGLGAVPNDERRIALWMEWWERRNRG